MSYNRKIKLLHIFIYTNILSSASNNEIKNIIEETLSKFLSVQNSMGITTHIKQLFQITGYTFFKSILKTAFDSNSGVFFDQTVTKITNELQVNPHKHAKILYLDADVKKKVLIIINAIKIALTMNRPFPLVLLAGEAGTGKTEISKFIMAYVKELIRITGSKKAPIFYQLTGSELSRYDEKTALAVLRKIMEPSKKNTIKILFIDEAEVCLMDRDRLQGEQSTGRLLLLNDFLSYTSNPREDLIVILTTNRLQDIDDAVNRRINIIVNFKLPNLDTIMNLLYHLIKKNINEYPDVEVFSDVFIDYKEILKNISEAKNNTQWDFLFDLSASEIYELSRSSQFYMYELAKLCDGISHSIIENTIESVFSYAKASDGPVTRENLEFSIRETVSNRMILYSKTDKIRCKHIRKQLKKFKKNNSSYTYRLSDWHCCPMRKNQHPEERLLNLLEKIKFNITYYPFHPKTAERIESYTNKVLDLISIDKMGVFKLIYNMKSLKYSSDRKKQEYFSDEILDIIIKNSIIPLHWTISPQSIEINEINMI